MPHQCVKCGRFIPTASKEIIEGCKECGGHFFFYVRDEKLEEIKRNPITIPETDKKQVEKDIRDIAGIEDEDAPVILDIESVRVTGAGKFEIDLVNLLNKKRPLIYKMDEGKYVIDLASTFDKSAREFSEIKELDKK